MCEETLNFIKVAGEYYAVVGLFVLIAVVSMAGPLRGEKPITAFFVYLGAWILWPLVLAFAFLN